MAVLVGFLIVGVILLIAAIFVGREATRMATDPPPPTFSMDDAFDWVVQHVPDEVAATLTPDDVKRILKFQMEYFKRQGAAVNGNRHALQKSPMVVGRVETVAYILERCAATGEAYLPEQVHAVVDTQLDYLAAIGALAGPATERVTGAAGATPAPNPGEDEPGYAAPGAGATDPPSEDDPPPPVSGA